MVESFCWTVADGGLQIEEDGLGGRGGGDVGDEFDFATPFANEEPLGVVGWGAEAEGLGESQGGEGVLDGDG